MITIKVGESTYLFESELERFFLEIRKSIIGNDMAFSTKYGQQKMLYADWTASGRLYEKIEEKMLHTFGPYVGNTHTESNITGTYMTNAYKEAKHMIKNHVKASYDDIILFEGFGMTAVVNKLQRLLGIKDPGFKGNKPVVFVTHMEHHSNYLSWIESNADVLIIPPSTTGDVDTDYLQKKLEQFKDRSLKIGAFTACSNVTGRKTDYHELAKIMHAHNGLCFVDFSASAPYISIDMHPKDSNASLDAIYFSPHKFLGGPGTSGVLVMARKLIANDIPDNPGGGTVDFTNPWGEILYKKEVEEREDGGTPGFLQAIKTALCIKLKEEMGIDRIKKREEELVLLLMKELNKINGVHILDKENKNRLGIVSITCEKIHYDLVVQLLNDRFGIQVRGGCSCAGPYGHYLLGIDQDASNTISEEIQHGDFSNKPGWVRISLHPTMSNEDIYQISTAIKKIMIHHKEWSQEYTQVSRTCEYINKHRAPIDLDKLFHIREV